MNRLREEWNNLDKEKKGAWCVLGFVALLFFAIWCFGWLVAPLVTAILTGCVLIVVLMFAVIIAIEILEN